MMKTTGRVTSCCLALFLILTSVSAVHKELNSINDLKKVNFGQSVPKHSLLLLHWFANTVYIDNNNAIWLTFNPDTDYGSHLYHNGERLLNRPRKGARYYTIGNLNQDTSRQFPSYVLKSDEHEGRNRDRIIIRVREQRINQVYITQHYEQQETSYDPDHTYQITPNLLREIREFSVEGNEQQLLDLRTDFESNADVSDIRHTWGDLACVGLFLFIVIQEKYFPYQRKTRPQNRQNNWDDDGTEMRGSNVPRNGQNQNETVVFFGDLDDSRSLIGNRESGNRRTSVPRNNNCKLCCYISVSVLCVVFIVSILVVIVIKLPKKYV